MTKYNTGNPIGSTAVKDLYDNAENLDELVNSQTKDSHPDRLGRERLTWKGITAAGTGDTSVAVDAAARAVDAAGRAENAESIVDATNIKGLVNEAETARDKAEDYRDDAREARDTVMNSPVINSVNMYLTTALGIAGTISGDMFWVFPNSDNDLENLVLYQNSSGTAVELYEHYNLNQFMYIEEQRYVE